jgi:hypothetical protein
MMFSLVKPTLPTARKAAVLLEPVWEQDIRSRLARITGMEFNVGFYDGRQAELGEGTVETRHITGFSSAGRNRNWTIP